VPVRASLLPAVNPITLGVNLIRSIPVGIDNALAELGLGRRLGTTPSGPYGVGGPALPPPPVTITSDAKTESLQPDTSTSLSTSTSTPTPTSTPTSTPKKPKKPTVRGPIEFDSQKTATESPSSPSEPTEPSEQEPEPSEQEPADSETTKPDSESSTESEDKDAA
jgi:hypothetical protein